MKTNCPTCGTGRPGVDALCDPCWSEYLGTHAGGRSRDEGPIVVAKFTEQVIYELSRVLF